jgi:lysozyme family protein
MANFDSAYMKTMGFEGGYGNDPDDVGGETYKGISRVYNPSWSGWKVIDAKKLQPNFPKNLNDDQELLASVKSFYKAGYWDVNLLDLVTDQDVAEEMFDTGVNLGVVKAAMFLQQSLNYLNRNESLYPDIVEDGKVGKKTMETLAFYLKYDKPIYLLKVLNVLQGMHYLNYMKKSPTQEKYARGWFSRVEISKK